MNPEFEIQIVETVAEAEELSNFLGTIWQGEDQVAPFDLILASIHVGGYAAIARRDNLAVGASFGFLGNFAGETVLHSHVTGASFAGAGLALKRHQFDWASQHELSAITWTFDPLVRRNCVFNFEKLGAIALEYLPNFYGAMSDDINVGDESDRLFAYWPLEPNVFVASSATAQIAVANQDGHPVTNDFEAAEAYWVELPSDIESLRKTNPELAQRWRKVVRTALFEPIESGWFIRSMNANRTAILVEPATSDYEFGDEE